MGEGEIMKTKNIHFSRIFVTLIGLIVGIFACFQLNANASTIKVNGLSGNQATITDGNGQVVTDQNKMGEYDYYKVTYHWSIPDSEKIEPGDTTIFTIPNGIRIRSDVTFDITDSEGKSVGKATIKAGASTGTITFTNVPDSFRYDRHGTLSFYGEGKQTQDTDINSWMVDKGGWVNDEATDKNGKPNQLYWNIVINPAAKSLSNVTFTDKPQDGQTIISSSITANKIVDDNGTYKIGASLTPKITHNEDGTETFDFGDIDYPIYIKYQTKVDSKDVTNTTNNWENVGMVHWNNDKSEQVTADIKYGGSGNENGYDGSVELTKYAQGTDNTLAGAVFNLEDDQGNVIKSNLATDSNGKIVIPDIKDGKYQFVEIKAPKGYELDSTPVKFTINDQNSQELHVKLTHYNRLASSSSSSLSSVNSSSSKLQSSSSKAVLSSSSSNQLTIASSSSQFVPNMSSSSKPVALSSSKPVSSELIGTSELTSTSRVIPSMSSNAMVSSKSGEQTSTNSAVSASITPIESSSSIPVIQASTSLSSLNSSKITGNTDTPATVPSDSNSNEVALSNSAVLQTSKSNASQVDKVNSNQSQIAETKTSQVSSSHKAETNKADKKRELPQTGEASTVVISVVGLILIIVGIVIYKEH